MTKVCVFNLNLTKQSRVMSGFSEVKTSTLSLFFNSSANKCSLKVAMYSAQREEYIKAIEIYEQVLSCVLGWNRPLSQI